MMSGIPGIRLFIHLGPLHSMLKKSEKGCEVVIDSMYTLIGIYRFYKTPQGWPYFLPYL